MVVSYKKVLYLSYWLKELAVQYTNNTNHESNEKMTAEVLTLSAIVLSLNFKEKWQTFV